MRVGLICSSGGSVFTAGIQLLRDCGYQPSAMTVTDRPCGAEEASDQLGIPWKRIEDPDRQGFSRKAAEWLFVEHQVDWTCLFFLRLVSSELFSRAPCANIHPSLLPAYPGFGAVRNAMENGSPFLGATGHFADDSTDSGPILAQVVAPISPGTLLETLNRLSFAQKLYVFLVLWEMAERKELMSPDKRTRSNNTMTPWANPCLRDDNLQRAFDKFLHKEDIVWSRQ